MDKILPINPHYTTKKRSLWGEFWDDFVSIFSWIDEPFGLVLSFFFAVIFVIQWTLFLISRYILRMNVDKPRPKKKNTQA